MSVNWAQRMVIHATRYLKEAFSEPGVLHTFREEVISCGSPESVNAFEVLTDRSLGGLTTAALRYSADDHPNGCLVFEGNFSSVVPKDAPAGVTRLGQAAFQSKLVEGQYLWLGSYERQVASTLNYEIRGDGRVYGIFLKTDSYFEGVGVNEIWQAAVRPPKDKWTLIKVPIVEFLLTQNGYVTEDLRVANLRRVTAVGMSVVGGGAVQEDGPFRICIGKLEAGYDEDRSSGNED